MHAPLITYPLAPCLIPYLLRCRCKISHFSSIPPWGGAGLDSHNVKNSPFHIPPPHIFFFLPTNKFPLPSLQLFDVLPTSAQVCQLVTRWRMRIQLRLNEVGPGRMSLCFAVEVCRLALETIEPKCHECLGCCRRIRRLLIRHCGDACLSWIVAYPDTHKDRWFVCCCVSEWKRRGWGSGWATHTSVCESVCMLMYLMPWKVAPSFICYSAFCNKEPLKSENMIWGEIHDIII